MRRSSVVMTLHMFPRPNNAQTKQLGKQFSSPHTHHPCLHSCLTTIATTLFHLCLINFFIYISPQLPLHYSVSVSSTISFMYHHNCYSTFLYMYHHYCHKSLLSVPVSSQLSIQSVIHPLWKV